MRVLISTTLGHNPGDELIMDGVLSLLYSRFKSFDYVLYNRNPDLQEGGAKRLARTTVGNYQTNPVDLSYIDMVVLAGSPEWTGAPMQSLYEAIDTKPSMPVLALGVGKGSEDMAWTELDQRVLKRVNTFIVTRSLETSEELLFKGIGAKPLVCPAFFSSNAYGAARAKSLLQIVQAPGTEWHEIDGRALEGMSQADTLVLHPKELKYFNSLQPNLYYAHSADRFRYHVAQYQMVLSTRLHGAIGALAQGIPSVVVTNGDYRIETAARMFGSILPVARNFEEAHKILLHQPKDIAEFQRASRQKWDEVMKHA